MFVVNLTYKVELEEIDKHLEAHIEFLKKQYAKHAFIASGRKNPRTGGMIFSKMENKEELLSILEEDPFKIHDLADYEVIEFIPVMTSKEFEILKE
ncbi:MAG: YciI family protein [Bacteroidota bacterium]